MAKKDDDTNWGKHLGLGLQVVVGVVLGLLAGQWLDRRYGWTPWGTMACAMLGLASGLYAAIKEAIKANKG